MLQTLRLLVLLISSTNRNLHRVWLSLGTAGTDGLPATWLLESLLQCAWVSRQRDVVVAQKLCISKQNLVCLLR